MVLKKTLKTLKLKRKSPFSMIEKKMEQSWSLCLTCMLLFESLRDKLIDLLWKDAEEKGSPLFLSYFSFWFNYTNVILSLYTYIRETQCL